MSFYNMLNGVTPATFIILPMLNLHADEVPRFRDCFTEDNKILIFTRTGGGNREAYSKENHQLTKIPGFIKDWDDAEDSTYAYFLYNIPEKWKDDFNKIMKGELKEVSTAYKEKVFSTYPKIKEKLEGLFLIVEQTA